MNKYNMALPEFKAFHQIKIGSNLLTDIVYLFNISGYYPIIIGKGDMMPRVWLYALVNGEIHTIVNNNNSVLLPLKLDYSERDYKLTCTFFNQISNESICILSLESNHDECIISKFDLRPFGLKIYLEGDTLKVGSTEFRHNNFSGNTFVTVE